MNIQRIQELTSQMNFRLREGCGECYYEIGVEDNGNALGIFQGLYAFLEPISYFEPLAGEWKKELGVTSLKDTSVKLAEEIYKVNLKDYVKKGKTDDIAEALLLSFYGLKKYYENNGG